MSTMTKAGRRAGRAAAWALWAVGAASAGAACGGPSFVVRAAPSLPRGVPTAPSLPEANTEQQVRRGEVGQWVTAARALPDLRAQALGVVVQGDATLAALARAMLARVLIGARYTRVLHPDVTQDVHGTLERGAGTAERTTLQGGFPQLALLQARTPAEQLLVLDLSANASAVVTESRAVLAPAEYERYRAAWAMFQSQVESARRQLAEGAAYDSEVSDAERRYLATGGTFGSVDDQEARDAVVRWRRSWSELSARLAQRSAEAVPPEELLRRVASQQSATRADMQRVALRAVLTDLRAGETYWMCEIVTEGAEQSGALREALGALVNGLGAGAPTLVAPPAAGTAAAAPTPNPGRAP